MYGTTEKVELRENNNFTSGINQNVTINAEFRSPKKDGTGDKVLCIDITGNAGQKFTVTEWSQSEEKTITNQLTRLRRWVKEVTGQDSFGTQFSSYEDMVNKFAEAVNGKGTLLEIKLVYGDNGYLQMPKYDGCVKAMSSPSRLTLSANEASRLTKPSATPTADTDLGLSTDTSDDLPF
jgi:hypothetical protein